MKDYLAVVIVVALAIVVVIVGAVFLVLKRVRTRKAAPQGGNSPAT
jgi:hypothetical protein